MEIGSLPFAPVRSPTGDAPRRQARDTAHETENTESQQRGTGVETLDTRALRARIAARELEQERFNLQTDLNPRARNALDSYLRIQFDTRDADSQGELVGLDLFV